MKELARKQHRQQALLRVVQQHPLGTQQELVRALKGAGFDATQATVSRDIVELGLVKVARNGAHIYAPPTAVASGGGTDRLRKFCEDYPVEGRTAGNLVAVAGDDTVFVATSTERHARSLLTRLTAFGIARKERS